MSVDGIRRDFPALARCAHLNGGGMASIPQPAGKERNRARG